MIEIKSDKILTPNGVFDGYLYIDGGKIRSVTKTRQSSSEQFDFSGEYVAPGFIDMHTHGGGGYAFMSGSANDVVCGANVHLKHGTTSILPTVSAGAFETMREAVINVEKAMRDKNAKSNIIGAHLEGPYLSVKQCGAQCPSFITKPIASDYERLIAEHGEAIARWTYAPENDENGEFCKYIVSNGVIASAGHTDATYSDLQVAIDNGCNLITHLYSCTSTVTRVNGFRKLGVIETAFLKDELFVEIIADGKHLPPELIKTVMKIKGSDKVALITDSLEIADTDIKEGVMSGTEFIVEDGVCKLKDRSAFAGSVATADALIRVMIRDCGYNVQTAVKTMTEVPAKILNLNKGAILEGKDADIITFDGAINVKNVFVGGRKVI